VNDKDYNSSHFCALRVNIDLLCLDHQLTCISQVLDFAKKLHQYDLTFLTLLKSW